MKIRTFLIITILVACGSGLFAQNESTYIQNDSTFAPDYKRNVIKWNLTPFLLWSKRNINISYERVLKPNRTFSVNVGYFVLPYTGIYDSLNIQPARKNAGFTVSGDYRYYFKKRNKNHAPDGLYWGPYGSFHYTQFENDILVFDADVAKGTLKLDANISILSAGVQLGYQFVVKERFTIDLIFLGPSLSIYSGKIGLGGDLDVDENNEYYKAIRDALISKFPFLDELVAEGEFSQSGFATNLGFGMRYMIQIGYRF